MAIRLLDYWCSSRVHCELKVAVAEVRGQFGNPEDGERLLLEAVTRRDSRQRRHSACSTELYSV
jgi:hypothetical protein